MTQHSVRLGVDIGGTFTDVVLEVGTASFSTKVLTTYIAPENAIIDGMHQVCAMQGSPHPRLARSSTAQPLPPTR